MIKACERNFESLELSGEQVFDDNNVFLAGVRSFGALGIAYPERYFGFARENGNELQAKAIAAYECELDDKVALRSIFGVSLPF